MKKFFAILIALSLALSLAACGEAPEADNGGISVVATTFAPYDFARQLVGDTGTVSMLLPPGSESHSYEPTPKDILEIQNADVFIYVAARATLGDGRAGERGRGRARRDAHGLR